MEYNARLFNCVCCQCQVLICSICDHGNIYCGPICSQLARTQLLKEVRRRYQKSRKGRFSHAEQQQRYRTRQKIKTQIVMDQGSIPPLVHDLLLKSNEMEAPTSNQVVNCHFCGRECTPFLRMDFLRGYVRAVNKVSPCWPSGP